MRAPTRPGRSIQGSTVTTLRAEEVVLRRARETGCLMDLEPPVPEPVPEVVAVARLGDHLPGDSVDLVPACRGTDGLQGGT